MIVITIMSGVVNDKIAWTVVDSCNADHYCDLTHVGNVKKEHKFFFKKLSQKRIMLWPGYIWQELDRMNKILREVNGTKKMRCICIIKEVITAKLLTFLALLIGAFNQPCTGREL